MKHLHIDCFIGISGDMTLAALIDLGADSGALERLLSGLGEGIALEVAEARKAGIAGTYLTVHTACDHPEDADDHAISEEHSHDEHSGERRRGLSYAECRERVLAAGLPDRVTERSLAVLAALGEAEAQAHGVALERVHFHELGGVDTLVDVCGVCLALDVLGVESVSAAPVPMSHGWVRCSHGLMPVPPPAVARLVQGLPVRPVDVEGETVTPTGAAIVKALANSVGEMPPMTVERIGHGAGKRDLDPYPNLLRLYLGERDELASAPVVVEIKTQIDDCTAEVIAYASERLMAEGALDVFSTPIQMKKGRLGTAVTVVARPGDAAHLADVLVSETSTIGLRMTECRRICLPREVHAVATPYGEVRVKVVRLPDGSERATPEYADCARVAAEAGVPVQDVMRAAACPAAE